MYHPLVADEDQGRRGRGRDQWTRRSRSAFLARFFFLSSGRSCSFLSSRRLCRVEAGTSVAVAGDPAAAVLAASSRRGPDDSTDRAAWFDKSDSKEPAEAAENAERSDPRDPTDSVDPTDPMESTDPTDPMERIDPTDPIERMEPLDPIERTDRSPSRQR